MKWLAISAFLMVVPSILSENLFLLDITPEEAQKYIASQSLDVNYAKKLGENPLPAEKDDDGDFVYQGRKIANPSDFTEEHYLANQFHGQDGLGRYMFGYTDWNQGRVEAKNVNGDVRGSYKYVDPHGKDFIVNYWADSLGFHHEDNRPKVILVPVTDTPEVQAAREEHFRKWKEIAEAAGENPDPQSDVYNRNANKYDEDQAQIDQALEIIGDQRKGEASSDSHSVEPNSKQGRVEPKQYWQPDENEPTGPPRGFFYSFDYPVQLKVENSARSLKTNIQAEEEPSIVKRSESAETSAGSSDEGQPKSLGESEKVVVEPSAVHDAQVHPKQKTQ